MFKSQGGKFSSVFKTRKDKRNKETPLHTGNWAPKKLLKYYLTAYYGTYYGLFQLIVAAQNNFQFNYWFLC